MKKYYSVSGTHCRSCELLLERHIGQLSGIVSVHADHRTGAVAVTFGDGTKPDDDAVAQAVRDAGYRLGKIRRLPVISRDPGDWVEAVFAVCVLFVLYLGYRILGLDRLGISASSATGPASALVVGLIAGVSTCMALIGGLVLGISARHAQINPAATARQRMAPHLMFNLGRVLSFVILGGLLGVVGSAFRIGGGLLGTFVIAAGAVMVVLGIKLTGLAPRIQNLTLPAGLARLAGMSREQPEYGHGRTAALGAATFLLPCAFTQTMQILAITTGSFTQGALIMGTFAAGTMPGLLGAGGLAALARGGIGRFFLKTAGVGVLLLGLWNMSNGWNLTGIVLRQTVPTAAIGAQASGKVAVAHVRDGSQYVQSEQVVTGYLPDRIRVKVGIPVVWTLTSTSSFTCASSIRIPALGIQRNLTEGPNVIEFTPDKPGIIKFSCSMGMFTGTIEVVE